MRRVILFLILLQISLILNGQIIADHRIVADFNKIPSYYMAKVKKMMINIIGESHSAAYRSGLELLEASYPAYSCNVAAGEASTDQYLRVNSGAQAGEDVWYTWYAYPSGSRPAASNTVKNLITEYNNHGHPMSVVGFGWCWDMTTSYESPGADPVYGCSWFGVSFGGPDGEGVHGWGLDAADFAITDNRVCMDTYLAATEDYISYCATNGYPTKVIFTTGPVEYQYTIGEAGYQGHVKHEYIRNYVKANPARILFDYADILCHDDNGTQTTVTWNGHIFHRITSTNLGDTNNGHIGNAGAIRLAKAQWWLLARIAGWDGNY